MCKLFVLLFLVWFLFVVVVAVVVAMCTLVRFCLTSKKPKFQKQLREGEKILEIVEKEQSSQASERESRCSDLCAPARAVLTLEMGVQPIPTSVVSPLPKGTVGLVLGRSSSALKGLNIVPGVIDPDFTGEIKILASSPRGIAIIAQGDRIAQLLVLPSCYDQYPSKNIIRGNKGLGSTGQNMVM